MTRSISNEILEMDRSIISIKAIDQITYQGADKSLARPGRKSAWKHVRDACDFSKIKTQAAIKFLFLQGKALKEIHTILTETYIYYMYILMTFYYQLEL